MDLPRVDFLKTASAKNILLLRNWLAPGLDARAIELVDWGHKKKIGPLAYIVFGLKRLCVKPSQKSSRAWTKQDVSGELILIGNGRFYGEKPAFKIFPQADLHDGLLDICIIPRADFPTMLHCAPNFLMRQKLPESAVQRFRAASFELSSETPAAFELDGEWVGNLPAAFSIEREKLRVITPCG